MSSHQETKRFRIQKLCDNCRLKKIKCDGNEVCRNCFNYQASCTYNHVPKKRKLKSKPQVGSPVEKKSTLESRVANVEGMLAQILDLVSKKSETGSVLDSVIQLPLPLLLLLPLSLPLPLSLQMKKEEKEGAPVLANDDIQMGESGNNSVFVDIEKQLYFGTHSSFSLFSPKGMKWISSKISKNVELIRYYQHIQLEMKDDAVRSHTKWIDPVDSTDVTPLPPFELFQIFLKAIFSTTLHVDLDLGEEELLQLYKKSEREPISHSDSLLLNVICCLGVPLASDFYHINPNFKVLWDQCNINTNSLVEIEEKCYTNCIFYYFRLSVIGDGISTIRSLLLLLAYTELSFNTDALYMIVSTAVRLAQEAGLHRYESYLGMDPEEAYKRIMLFSHCYLVDKAISLRSGKPPILNENDISSIGAERFRDYWYNSVDSVDLRTFKIDAKSYLEYVSKPVRQKTPLQLSKIRKALKEKLTEVIKEDPATSLLIFVKFYFLELMEISSSAYDRLFSAQLLIGKTALEVEEIVFLLNKKLDDWYNGLPEILKIDVGSGVISPISLFDGTSDNFLVCQSLFNQLQYHFVHMTINRMSSKTSWVPTDDMDSKKNTSSSIDLCLDSARILIKLSQRIDTRASEFFKYCLFFPFCAFITLFCSCLQDLAMPHTKEDIKLMIGVAFMFLECAELSHSSKLRNMSRLVTFLSVLTIEVYEKTHPDDKTFRSPNYAEFFKDMYDDIDIYTKNLKRNKKRHRRTHSGIHASTNLTKSTNSSPQPVLMQNCNPLINNAPMLTTGSEATNLSPSSTSSNTHIFGDLMDDPLLMENFGSYNYFNQNLFNLPNFMLDGGAMNSAESNMDIFDF